MALPAEGYRLEEISAKAYEHPADRAATATLKAIPHLDTVVRKLIELGYERAIRRGVLGSAVRLGEDQLAHVWAAHNRAYATLDLEPTPDLYLTAYPIANALTIGAGRPIVVVNSELVQLLGRRAAACRGRARGRPRPLRPRPLPHGARDPDAHLLTARRAGASAPAAGRADGVVPRRGAEL
jgi:hypothetical protein